MPSVTRHGAVKGAATTEPQTPPRTSRLKRLDVNDKIIKTSRSAKDASANEPISPRKSTQKNFDTPTKSTRASKRQHASDSGDDSEEIPKTRSRGNQEKTKKVRSKRGSSPGGSSRIAKKNKDDSESESEEENHDNGRQTQSSKRSINNREKRSKEVNANVLSRSTRSTRSLKQKEETDSSSIEDDSSSGEEVVIVRHTKSQPLVRSNRKWQESQNENDGEKEDTSDDEEEVVQVNPRGRRAATRSQTKGASYEEVSDSLSDSEDSDEDITEITDDEDDEVSFKGSPKPARRKDVTEKTDGGKPMLANALNELTSTLARLKEQYEVKLKQKDEEINRLKNDLKYKDEQLEDMQNLTHQNMEMEAKISLMMSSKEAYEKEVEQMHKAKKEREGRKKKEESSKTNDGENRKEMKKDNEGKSPVKRPAVSTEDSDIEIIENDDEEGKPPKAKSRKRQNSVEEITEEEEGEKKKKRSRRRKGKKDDNDEDNIDTLFVSDDSADEEDKKETKKKEKKKKDEETEEKKRTEDDEEDDETKSPGRHNIRKIMTSKKITQETKAAAQEEKERRKRVEKAKSKHYKVEEKDPKTKTMICKKLVLDYKDDKDKTPIVEVLTKLIKKLKPHQVEAVEFMWDCLIESAQRLKEGYDGSGCILAHCMGLGKTLSVIALMHTLMTNAKTSKKFRRCLVVCPLNTVLNWQTEWKKWLDKRDQLPVYELASSRNNHDRCDRMKEWYREGGIMIIGYQLFRILVNLNTKSKKRKQIIDTGLLDPGPDVVVCDEGHMLKNDSSAISKAMNRIKTRRRIILTGTPLQNNLVEYHCMVSLVKPSLLGTRREFGNRFVNPITNGQHADSTPRDVKVMKRRAHVLHEMLAGCVQRKDYSVITKLLPPKHEYVIAVRLSKIQIEMYEKYLELNVTHDPTNPNRVISRGASLFADYQNLMRVWTHPWVLKLNEEREEKKFLTAIMAEERRIIKQEVDEKTANIPEMDQKTAKGYTESDDDELESLLEISSESEVEETTTASSAAESNDEDEKTYTPRRSTRRSLRNNKSENESDKEESKKDKKKEVTDSSKTDKENDTKNTKGGREKQKEDKKDEEEDEEDDNNGKRKAKVIAGEVIKNWQSMSRGNKGDEGDVTRKKEDIWWTSMVSEEQKTMVELSGKLVLLFEILRMAQSVGDKVLVFSQSILSLDLIEDFLSYKTEEAEKAKKKSPRKGGGSTATYNKWVRDEDYYRMDGSTGAERRKQFTTDFNNTRNERMRLFLISTKAGGLGINLDTANRVIIFDASWNPSHDIQSIFRVYRFGQVKPVYVYRLLAQGTMEEKIYERQIIKEALSERVVDEHQLDRHFNAADLQELYRFRPERLDDPEIKNKPTPKVPDDVILAELLSTQKDWIVGYHEHDSLLEKRPEENLSEEERKAAWEEYEREKQGLFYGYGGYPMQQQMMNNLVMTQAPIQMPRNPPFTSYLRLPQPKPTVQVPVLPAVQRVPVAVPGTSGAGSEPLRANYQSTQLPRVIQEIIKYNPSIKPEELEQRLRAFMGMQNKAQNAVVPGFAMGTPQIAPVSSQPGGAVAGMMRLVHGLPVAQPLMATTQIVRPVVVPSAASTPGIVSIVPANLPSRLPQPGIVPAANNK